MFVVEFPMAPLTCDPSEYSNYSWTTGGTYEATPDMFVVDFPMAALTCDPSEYSNYSWTTGGPGTYEATPAM